MPLNSESPSTRAREDFCLALRAARERKGVTLAAIAASTKIPTSLFAALERSDLRCWPKGLFRRSFFRDYVGMIGMPVAETCDEFVRLFPDDDATAAVSASDPARDLRLTLDPAWHGPPAPLLMRLIAAVVDMTIIVLVAAALVWVRGFDPSTTVAIVALAYGFLATATLGESPAKWAIAGSRSMLDSFTHGPATIAALWQRPPESVEEDESHDWLSDARRIEPDLSQQLRVRIKMSQ